MTKSKTIGYFLFGMFVLWYLIGSGMGIAFTKNIISGLKGESIINRPVQSPSGAYYIYD